MTNQTNQEPIDYDALSDEEFAKLDLPEEPASNEEVYDEPQEFSDPSAEDDVETNSDEDQLDAEVIETNNDSGEDNSDEADNDTEELEADDAKGITSLDELSKVNFAEPLKLGGSDITVNSVEELVTLAQRGVGSSKRMQQLAPQLKTLSTLEANGLLDKDKINFMIALDKKDPAAVKKLLADSGIDPLDVGTNEAEGNSTPEDYSVTNEEFAVEQAFSSIAATDSYNETLETIKGFSDSDKIEIRNDPKVIGQLNTQIANGEYKEVQDIVAKERLLGNFEGVSDFAAYKHVMNTIREHQASMGRNPEAGHKNLTGGQNGGENLASSQGTDEAGHNTQSGKRVAKAKAAAAATNKSRGSQQAETIDWESLSDEELAKLEVSDVFK